MKNICYINAGAGSGKTFRLTQELTEYLLEKDVHPSEVILTTFTELAASEFKEKARQAILSSTLKTNEQRIQLATEMGAAAIGTVHSIALNFIQRYWYSLHLGADIQVMSPNNQDIYLNQSLADILTADDIVLFHNYETQFSGSEEMYGLRSWQYYLREVITKMSYYQVTELSESLKRSKETLRSIFTGIPWNEQIKKEFDQLLQQKIIYLESKINKTNQEKIKLIKENKRYDESYRQFTSLRKIFEKTTKTFLKSLPSDELERWDSFTSFENSESYLPFLETFVERIFDVASRWNQQYTAFKEQHHMLSYNDMELNLLDLLENNEEVRQEIRERYKLLMVDEFQDSNPIQLKIFNIISELIAENGGQTIWVGDPKQAIYSFRGADTELITSIARAFEQPNPADHLTCDNLPESWRSREPLVDVVNQVFTNAFTTEEFPNRDHICLKAHFADDLRASALQEWQLEGKNAEKRDNALAYQVQQLIASNLEVKPKDRKKAARTLTYKDIAILANWNDEVASISKALRRYGLPVDCTEQNILQRKEVQLVKTLLAYCTEPWNTHLRADLAYMLHDETTEELLNDRLNYLRNLEPEDADQWKKDETFLQPIHDLCKRIYRLSLSEIVTSVINELNLYAIIQKWGEANIRRQNLNTLIELAKTYDESCQQMGLGATIIGYLNYIETTEIERVQDNTSNTIKVLTYHRSKGLEWPVVILCSLGTETASPQNILKKNLFGVNEHQLDDGNKDPFNRSYYIHLLPKIVGNKNTLPATITEVLTGTQLYNQTFKKTISERKRLLYVGMTRARDYLIAAYQQDQPLKWLTEIGINSDGQSNCWGAQGHTSDLITIDSAIIEENEMNTEQTYTFVQKPSERTERTEKYLSPSKLTADRDANNKSNAVIRILDEISPVIPRSNWQDMALIGTCIHNIFAIYQLDNNQNQANATRVIDNFGLGETLGPIVSQIINSVTNLYHYLTAHYGPAESIDKELPFYHEVDSHIVHGEMDLVWNYRKENMLYSVLVDYKTFPGAHSILTERTQEYIPQLKAYKQALEAGNRQVQDCLIFYAVQGSIAEVKLP